MDRTLLLGLSCILFAGCVGKSKPAFAPALTLESPESNAATTTYRQSESAVIGCNALPLRRL